MSRSITKLQRWLDIIAYLVIHHWPVSADELMRNVPAYAKRWDSGTARQRATVRRTFERDKDELRHVGIPIRTVKYSRDDEPDVLEGYQLDRHDFYLPYLKLVQQVSGAKPYRDRGGEGKMEIAERDAPLALDALRRIADVPGFPLANKARSAFRKLAFDLDPLAYSSHTTVLFMDPPGAAELTARLRTLSGALLARKRVTFRYRGIRRGEETSRDVAPYGLLFQHGQWYVIGHDYTRDAVRVFRVGRTEDVVANRKAPGKEDYDIPPDFSLDDYIGREAWDLGDREERPVEARVLFRFPLSLWAERNGYGEAEERRGDGSAVRRFAVYQVDPFVRWLLSLEGDAKVLEPASLRAELHALARRIGAAHAEEPDAGA